MIHATSF